MRLDALLEALELEERNDWAAGSFGLFASDESRLQSLCPGVLGSCARNDVWCLVVPMRDISRPLSS